MNETIKLIQNHRSIRTFLDKNITEETLDQILKSAQAMPNSINGQQTSVIVVRDKETKQKLAHLTGNPQIIHESIEGTLAGSFDAGIAMGGTVIAAESLGIGIVPIGGIRKNSEEVIELLELPKYTYPVAGLALGYPADNSKQKPRMPFETFKHNEKYNADILKPAIDKYDTEIEAYLKETGRESQEGNWSIFTSNIYKSVYYPKVFGAIKDQGFKNDK